MKQLTCKDVGGPCDAILEGNTPDELTTAASEHIEEMAETDPAHKKSYDEMVAIYEDKDRHAKWQQEFQEKWDEAPEL